jgi:DNA-binding MarR family transcriptional regulator
LETDPKDVRRRLIRLTDRGREAMARESVLDSKRLAAVLGLLSPAERMRAVAGLDLLARAARRYREGEKQC